jgi:hypothetical protein
MIRHRRPSQPLSKTITLYSPLSRLRERGGDLMMVEGGTPSLPGGRCSPISQTRHCSGCATRQSIRRPTDATEQPKRPYGLLRFARNDDLEGIVRRRRFDWPSHGLPRACGPRNDGPGGFAGRRRVFDDPGSEGIPPSTTINPFPSPACGRGEWGEGTQKRQKAFKSSDASRRKNDTLSRPSATLPRLREKEAGEGN